MKSWVPASLIFLAFPRNMVAQSPTPSLSPWQTPVDYDLRWGVKIPMHDRVELNATLYLPKMPNGSAMKTPVIFTLTPYISDTYHDRGAYFASHGYAFALVDVRGRGNSGGEFDFLQKNYCSGGVVAEETPKDAHTFYVQIYHDAEHASTISLPLR